MRKQGNWATEQMQDYTGGYTGASTGLFAPGADAKRILGKLNFGEMFAYLFRRFGYPKNGWDDYKQLVRYDLKTPLEGIALIVSPQHTGSSFGYLLRRDLDKRCDEEVRSPRRQWQKNLYKFAEKRGVFLFDSFSPDEEIIGKAWQAWLVKNPRKPSQTRKLHHKAFIEAQLKLYEEYSEKFREKCPLPIINSPYTGKGKAPGELTTACHEALCRTIEDLTRSVAIRDSLITIRGPIPPSKQTEDDRLCAVKPSEMAGYGVTTEVYQNPDRWFSFCEKLRKLGNGNLMKGISKANRIIKL